MGVAVALASVVSVPTALAGMDPAGVAGAGGPVRAAASFVSVLLVGTVLRSRFGGRVERAVDDLVDRPRVAVFYGALAYGILLLTGLYANDILIRTATLGTAGFVVFGALVLGMVLLTSVGYAVLGSVVTELWTGRRSWLAPVLGAAISVVPWLLLSFSAGTLAWIVLAAFGIGGRTRTWVHATRSTDYTLDD